MCRTQTSPGDSIFVRRQEEMIGYIPGGVHCCAADEQLTLLSISDGFLELLGYTREEIKEQFHDHFLEMILPEERESILAQIERQLRIGNTITIEYRIKRKDGALRWILDKGRGVCEDGVKTVYYCMLIDVTEQHEEKEQLWLSLDRYRAILDQVSDIIFEWDMKRDTLSFSANWQDTFGFIPLRDHISTSILGSKYIHEKDIIILKELMADILGGAPYSETEIRIKNVDGKIIHCRIRVTNRYDWGGHPAKAIGIISDISKEKNQRQLLIEKSRRDSLTGLLHKKAAKQTVEEYLIHTDNACGIMLIMDLDDFKLVNDHFGHLCGDTLLTETAAVLRKVFRGSDIISRVGGDEFLVFLPGTAKNRLEERIRELKQELLEIEVSGKTGLVSCSVGAAFLPDHALDFNSLFRCADLALYQVKCGKKGTAIVYSPNMEIKGFPGRFARTSADPDNDADKMFVCDLLGQYSFRVLYDAQDVPKAVRELLKVAGQAYGVSRVYLFEDSEDSQTSSNTFEWCNEGIAPLILKKHDLLSCEALRDYYSNFDENGIFYYSDAMRRESAASGFFTSRNIFSSLQCAIKDRGRICGFVGFDECSTSRRWTKEQIESLTLVSRVLSTFLFKYRLEEKVETFQP